MPAVPLPRVNDSTAFNARVIDGTMEKLNGWWSQPPAPADRAAAALSGSASSRST